MAPNASEATARCTPGSVRSAARPKSTSAVTAAGSSCRAEIQAKHDEPGDRRQRERREQLVRGAPVGRARDDREPGAEDGGDREQPRPRADQRRVSASRAVAQVAQRARARDRWDAVEVPFGRR